MHARTNQHYLIKIPVYKGPVASIFWLDEELGSDLYLDGIVTLVDAKHCITQVRTGIFEANQFRIIFFLFKVLPKFL